MHIADTTAITLNDPQYLDSLARLKDSQQFILSAQKSELDKMMPIYTNLELSLENMRVSVRKDLAILDSQLRRVDAALVENRQELKAIHILNTQKLRATVQTRVDLISQKLNIIDKIINTFFFEYTGSHNLYSKYRDIFDNQFPKTDKDNIPLITSIYLHFDRVAYCNDLETQIKYNS